MRFWRGNSQTLESDSPNASLSPERCRKVKQPSEGRLMGGSWKILVLPWLSCYHITRTGRTSR